MAFTSNCIQNVLFVRWVRPQPGDSRTIVELSEEHSLRTRGRLIYIGIVPENCPSPNEQVRREMAAAFPRVLTHCNCIHLVLEGSGLGKAVLRTIAAGIFLVGGQRGRVTTHDTSRDALERCPFLNSDVNRILDHAMELGLVLREPEPARLNRT